MKGLFITFEGIDGCGKSTQIRLARVWLESKGYSCMVSREPGGTKLGEKIRNIILSTENFQMSDRCEVLLYCAARAQHVREKILPALRSGTIVLCDRFDLATFAYQGYGRGLSLSLLRKINSFATEGLTADLSFVFDLPVNVALSRLAMAPKSPDRIESNSRRFFQKVRKGYSLMARANPKSIRLLNAAKTVEEVAEKVRKELTKILKYN